MREQLKKSDPASFTGYEFMSLEQRRPAAESTLEWLLENCNEPRRQQIEPLRPLRFTQVELFLDQGTVREKQFAFDERPPR